MTSMGIRIVAVGAAFYVAAAATTAEAAKGVKKVGQASGQHTVTGEVLNVNHRNGGSFYLRTAHHHKKYGTGSGVNAGNPGGAVNAAGGKRHHHGEEFHVTSATRFEHHNGSAASLASLQARERVRVTAVGHQATNVQILSHQRSYGNVWHHHRRRF